MRGTERQAFGSFSFLSLGRPISFGDLERRVEGLGCMDEGSGLWSRNPKP